MENVDSKTPTDTGTQPVITDPHNTQDNHKTMGGVWYRSLIFQLAALITFLLLVVGLIAYLVINIQGRPQMNAASDNLIIQTGNEAVSNITTELMKVNGFATGLSSLSDGLPNDYALYENSYAKASPNMPTVAVGTGFWFEPYMLDATTERRALYWWENFENQGRIELTRDYEDSNIIPDPYYQDWWYVPARYGVNHSLCVWSGSFIDPVSQNPMVTCARPIKDDSDTAQQSVKGVVTVDMDSSFVQDIVKELQEVTGGYMFLTDTNSRFISFPDMELVKQPTALNPKGDYITANDLAEMKPEFKPIADELDNEHAVFIQDAKAIDSQRFNDMVQGMLSNASKLTKEQAESQAAQVLISEVDPTDTNTGTGSDFVKTIQLDNDFYLNSSARAYIFRLPYTYWSLVVVKPESEIGALADSLSTSLLKYFIFSLIPLVLIGLLVLYYLFGRPMNVATSAVQNLTNLVRNRRFGELATNKLKDTSESEIGLIGQSMNQLVDTLTDVNQQLEDEVADRTIAQQKAEAENEKLNNSVISILQSVQQLSQRDLTVKAPVTDDIIGTVSDSINYLTDETSQVLQEVTNVAGQVQDSSQKVQTQAEVVSQTAQQERQSVDNMVESLFQATQTMNQVAALAEDSNQAAAQATEVTDNALETVTGTVKGMESIRETIAETEKRIKRLGERSQEISGIVNLINTISERTHVLALNASMQAAVAGEAGRGFAVVAEEVQRLAESSRNATQQIASLVGNIQIETNETINTVNNTIAQVVEGSSQAQKAGEQMKQTQQITEKLVNQVRSIALASEQQKVMSAELLEAVQQIGESTEQTAEQIEAQNQETSNLQQAAQRLVESVGVFKLPA